MRSFFQFLRGALIAATAEAARIHADYQKVEVTVAPHLKAAAQWSLYDPRVHEKHFAALVRLAALAR